MIFETLHFITLVYNVTYHILAFIRVITGGHKNDMSRNVVLCRCDIVFCPTVEILTQMSYKGTSIKVSDRTIS